VALADGTYSMSLVPGLYVVLVEVDRQVFQFATPDVGDDATDSDMVQFESDPFEKVGLSDLVDLLGGGEAVIDVGLVPLS
jgi:hypothetical protein